MSINWMSLAPYSPVLNGLRYNVQSLLAVLQGKAVTPDLGKAAGVAQLLDVLAAKKAKKATKKAKKATKKAKKATKKAKKATKKAR